MNHARKAWKISYSRGVPSTPARRSGALYVPMPGPNGSIHYLHTLRPAVYDRRGWRPSLSYLLGVTVVMSEDAIVANSDPNDVGGLGPTIRPFLFRHMQGVNNRWWSAAQSVPVTPGYHQIDVPLQPAVWTQVYGKPADSSPQRRAAFKACIDDGKTRIGVTCGMGNHYGHGWHLSHGSGYFLIHTAAI